MLTDGLFLSWDRGFSNTAPTSTFTFFDEALEPDFTKGTGAYWSDYCYLVVASDGFVGFIVNENSVALQSPCVVKELLKKRDDALASGLAGLMRRTI